MKPTRPPDRPLHPFESAGFFSRITFWWLNALVSLGFKRPLEADDLPEIPFQFASSTIDSEFERIWKKEMDRAERKHTSALSRGVTVIWTSGRTPSLFRAMIIFRGVYFSMAGPLKLIHDTLQVCVLRSGSIQPIFPLRSSSVLSSCAAS